MCALHNANALTGVLYNSYQIVRMSAAMPAQHAGMPVQHRRNGKST